MKAARTRQSAWTMTVALALTLLTAGSAQALYAKSAEGTLQFPSINLQDASDTRTDVLDAAYMSSSGSEPLDGTLEIEETAQLTVNWTHARYVDAGESPSNPQEPFYNHEMEKESEEESYEGGTVVSTFERPLLEADILLKAQPEEANATLWPQGGLSAEAAENERWAAGLWSNQAQSDSNVEMTATYDLPERQPVLRAPSGSTVDWSIQGSFTLYVWGPNVTVATNTSETTYRSGSWTTTQTPAVATDEGMVRETHRQLLRLEFVNATMRFTQEGGLAQWTAPTAEASTKGTTVFHEASGIIDLDERYRVPNAGVTVTGQLTMQMNSAPEGQDRLTSTFQAQNANIEGPLVPTNQESGVGGTLLETLLIVAGLLMAGGVGYGIRNVRVQEGRLVIDGTSSDSDPLQAGRAAIQRFDAQTALKHGKQAVQEDPENHSAWMLYGGALIQAGEYADAIPILEEGMEKVPEPKEPEVAVMLAMALINEDRLEEAWPWIERAADDEALHSYFWEYDVFEPIREDPRLDALLTHEEDEDVELAYA